jgi:uncharacterized membrane protein
MPTFRTALLPAAACLWVAIICLSPVALRRGTAPVATFAVYTSASILCHQKTERSFRPAGIQMPVCGRCFGLYASGALGAVAALLFRRRSIAARRLVVTTMLAIAAVPILLSVGLEWAGVIEGSNASRFASALPLGVVVGWLLQRTIATTDLGSGPPRR